MGKASRRKAENRKMDANARKLMKELIKESQPNIFVVEDEEGNRKSVYYNPLKKLMKGEPYKSTDGIATTIEMAKKYKQFFKTRATIEKEAKVTGIDPDNVIKENN